MVNRKGFIKIVEASIAILVIFAVIIILVSRDNIKRTEDLSKIIPPMLEEIALNNNLRKKVLSYDILENPENAEANRVIIEELEDFVMIRVRAGINYRLRICKTDELCPIGENYPLNKDGIYAVERIISSDLDRDEFSPWKVKIFLWKSLKL